MKKLLTERKLVKNAEIEKTEDINKLPKYRLLEMLERQNKLFNNKEALAKLPDKGEKVKQIKKRIEDELEKRESCSKLSEVMANLNLTAPQLNALEWTKNIGDLKNQNINERLNESEDSPLQILATHSGTVFSMKTIKIEEQPQPLITEKDIEEVYAAKLSSKIDKVEPQTRFLPHKTLCNTYTSKKSSSDYKPENLCSASQPPSKFFSTKPVSLETSIKLQFEQAQHLKEVQLKHAAERLKDKTYTIGNYLPSRENLKMYRDPANINSDSDGEEEEEELQEIEDEGVGEDREGTVTYQVVD